MLAKYPYGKYYDEYWAEIPTEVSARASIAAMREWDTGHLSHDEQSGFYRMIDAALDAPPKSP
jgi:hypothetical protein